MRSCRRSGHDVIVVAPRTGEFGWGQAVMSTGRAFTSARPSRGTTARPFPRRRPCSGAAQAMSEGPLRAVEVDRPKTIDRCSQLEAGRACLSGLKDSMTRSGAITPVKRRDCERVPPPRDARGRGSRCGVSSHRLGAPHVSRASRVPQGALRRCHRPAGALHGRSPGQDPSAGGRSGRQAPHPRHAGRNRVGRASHAGRDGHQVSCGDRAASRRRRSSRPISGPPRSTRRSPTACSATPMKPTISSRSPRRIPGAPSCPSALAMAERRGRSGMELLRAVALGYDLCCRFLLALGPDLCAATHRSAEGTSSTMGGVAAAASLARLDEKQMRYALSYAAQQVSGLWSWTRDTDHVEKAFDFSGMGARNGVTAVIMVQAGFTGVAEVLDGEHNVLDALSTEPSPRRWWPVWAPGSSSPKPRSRVFSVGYPIQAALDAFLTLAPRAQPDPRQRRAHPGPAAGRRRPRRRQQRDARRQLPAPDCGGA